MYEKPAVSLSGEIKGFKNQAYKFTTKINTKKKLNDCIGNQIQFKLYSYKLIIINFISLTKIRKLLFFELTLYILRTEMIC